MTITELSIKKPVFAWMLMAGLLVFGMICYSLMGVSQLPDVDFPVITVTVTWSGATPDVMESAVADIIESAVMSVDGVQLVQSTSQQGQTQIIIQFSLEQDINVSLEQVQTKVSQAQKNLPQTIDPPVITKTNPADQPIMWMAVYGLKTTLRELALFVRDSLKDRITTVNGVGDVFLGGFVDPQMRIWVDNFKMKEQDVTVTDIINAVNMEHLLAPTGFQDYGEKENFVRVHSEFTNAQECNGLVIPQRTGAPVFKAIKISELGHCEEGTDEVRRISRYNGITPTIGLGVIKQHGTNAVMISNAVRSKVKQLREFLPPGMGMDVVTDTTVFVKDAVNELLLTLSLAVILTSVVCYFFLGTFSSSINVILAIPVSLIGTFIILKSLGFTVNAFTLMGLSLSIGIVVDDAIMVLENITRHVEGGQSRVLGAFDGTREITGAAIASSLALLAIFIPVVFMRGIIGKFFYQFGVTISAAVMISLLEALTLAPMRCSQFLNIRGTSRITTQVNKGMDLLTRSYRDALKICLKWRWTVLVVSSALFLFSLIIFKFLRQEFLPPQDQSRFLVTIYTPMGSSLALTDHVFREAEKIYHARPEVLDYYIAVGGFGGGLVNQGISFVTMKDFGDRPIVEPFKKRPSQQEFMGYLRQELRKIPNVERVAILDMSLTGFSAQRGYPIEFELIGPDWKKLGELSLTMRDQLKKSGFMADIDSDYNPNMPETEIMPKRVEAAKRGVPVASISSAISAMVGGLKLLPNKYTDSSGHREDIQIKLLPYQNQSEFDISNIQVHNVEGWSVQLKDVVDLQPGSTLLSITRYNRERAIGIFGNFRPEKSQSDVLSYIQELGKKILPEKYHLVFSGSAQAFRESVNSLLYALILGIIVSYMILASQFNSFLHPVVILLALPFSVTGAFLAMKLSNTSMNVYSMIGILLLMGIVKKNSILLVDFTNQKRATGMGVQEALTEACPIRLRPILMTSIATIAGAIPSAVIRGPGSEVMHPMAIAVIGGVFVSTLLTLFVVPCAYSLLVRLERGDRFAAAEEIDKR